MHKWVGTDNTTSVLVTSESRERDKHVGDDVSSHFLLNPDVEHREAECSWRDF